MESVPNCRKEIPMRHAIRWFKCKLKPPKNQGTHMTPHSMREQGSGRTPPLTREQGINMDMPSEQVTFPRTQQQAGNEKYCLNCQ